MKKILVFIVILLAIAYPFAVYFGLQYFSPRYLAVGIAFIFLLRFVVMRSSGSYKSKLTLILITIAGILVSVVGAISNNLMVIKLYPVVISLLMFAIFLYSRLYPPTIIERIAKFKYPNLPPEAIAYVRKLTVVWCGFFIFNALVALWTALFATVKIWTFYNGFLSYILMGTLIVAELIYRKLIKKQ